MPVGSLCAGLVALLAATVAGGGASREATLIEAAGRGDVARVRALAAAGADVNARDGSGRTALVRAVVAGSLPTVAALVAAGADVGAADRNGLTALIEAARLGHPEIARALLDAGADPDMRHRALGTALDVAEHGGQTALARLLRERGARGAGRSVGDVVCVRPWDGSGYCGRILAIEGARYRLRLSRLVGCERGCAPGACSAGRPLGVGAGERLGVGMDLWVESACLTDTGIPAQGKGAR